MNAPSALLPLEMLGSPWLFPVLAIATWVLVPIYAFVQRGRTFAIFSSVIFGFTLIGAFAVHSRLPLWVPDAWLPAVRLAFALGMAAAAVHYAHLVRARMRGRVFRWLASVPGQAFVAASFMATVWMGALLLLRLPLLLLGAESALQWIAPLDVLPYAVATIALFTSPRPVFEVVRVELGKARPDEFGRVPVARARRRGGHAAQPAGSRPEDGPLRIVQITDPHLGPWQPIHRMQALVRDLAAAEPDLVLLTGDFLTMESNETPGALAEALTPLRELEGSCFAIFGNHDHEAPDEVRSGLEANRIHLLVDDATTVRTRCGPVQIVGADYRSKERRDHLEGLLAAHPRPGDDHLRVLMLHDPSAFHDLPDGEVDLVLSGHTHGGQVGLVSLGFDWTVLARTRWPDHGLFARGSSHLYVHRGSGFYGFPLRVGVPGEASVLEILS